MQFILLHPFLPVPTHAYVSLVISSTRISIQNVYAFLTPSAVTRPVNLNLLNLTTLTIPTVWSSPS